MGENCSALCRDRKNRKSIKPDTEGTCNLVTAAGIPAVKAKKLYEGRPNVGDMITNGDFDLIINSPVGKDSVHDDSYLRKATIKAKRLISQQLPLQK